MLTLEIVDIQFFYGISTDFEEAIVCWGAPKPNTRTFEMLAENSKDKILLFSFSYGSSNS